MVFSTGMYTCSGKGLAGFKTYNAVVEVCSLAMTTTLIRKLIRNVGDEEGE